MPAEFIGPSASEPITPAFTRYALPLLGGALPRYTWLPERESPAPKRPNE